MDAAQNPFMTVSNTRMQTIINAVGILGLIVHALLIVDFIILAIPELVVLEVFSTLAWYIALRLNRSNNTSGAVLLMVAEVLVHSTVVILYLGLAPGFQHYLWAAVPFILFYRKIPLWGIVTCTLLCMGLFVACYLFAQDIEYTYAYAELLPYIHVSNVIIAFMALGLTCFHFYNATIEAEQEIAKMAAEKVQLTEETLAKKNTFFANVSHEFRTPLTLITGPLESIIASTDLKAQKPLKKILANAKRLQRLVEQTLELTKADFAQPKEHHTLALNALAEQLSYAFISIAREKNIEVHCDTDVDCLVDIASQDAEAIVCNLLSNAIKYSKPDSKVTIRCTLAEEQAQLCVSDSGIGIAPEDQHRIFERFVRLDTPMSKTVAGTGIGLALVKDLVERAKGQIQVVSDGVSGTQFTVTFPLSHGEPQTHISLHTSEVVTLEQANLEHQITSEVVQNSDDSTQHLPRILIVEDNPDMQSYLADCLSHSHQLLFASDGESGFMLAKTQVPDLILSDLMMPKVDGFQLAQQLREEITTCHIPILMLTAKGDEESQMLAWKMDIDAFMSKPFNTEQLKTRIQNLLNIRTLISQRIGALSSAVVPTAHQGTKYAGLSNKDIQFIEQLEQWLAAHFTEQTLSIKCLLPVVAMSERQLQRKFKALLGQTFSEYVKKFRLNKGAEMLANGMSVTQVAFECGFSSQSYFSLCFKAQYGIAPSQFNQQ
ncbi:MULTISPECIES: ATP-binding protein [unclassified Pseudoalteromonas]|uniref:hybrid sensor histidine kinase/response regulator transcription factor n=1 Tax=unclassified Pseudoalteromonas TaxID=194690 RepID=UPI002097101B|nr:ATP-binding protein [Pseudoalteromonas sp. XMcav2-N]MCO7189989.1 ATP-binding protein [Pseudoalteromonas sp. XMcav2-N]